MTLSTWLFSLVVVAPSAFAAETVVETLGGPFESGEQELSYKLNVLAIDSDCYLDAVAPYLDVGRDDRIEILVYQEDGFFGQWDLIYTSGELNPENEEAFTVHSGMDLELEAGENYAVGFHIKDSPTTYFYDNGGGAPMDLSVGSVSGAMFSGEFGALLVFDPLFDDVDSDLVYYMELTFIVPEDLDGDGADEFVDCDDDDPTLYPGAIEICDEVDNDCDGLIDNDVVYRTVYPDADGDGYGVEDEAIESCEALDGYSLTAGDCADDDPDRHPDLEDVCDEVDNDCDEAIDEDAVLQMWWPDEDLDGFGRVGDRVETCDGTLEGYATNNLDCDDDAPDVYPDAPEFCDEIDNDCDEAIDEQVVYSDWWPDADGDGYGDASVDPVSTCDGAPEGFVGDQSDCDDSSADVYEGATETCDGADNDCDGSVDEDLEVKDWYPDLDGDGFGDSAVVVSTCDGPPDGHVAESGDCDDADATVYPGARELCDGVDNDCDGNTLDGERTDLDADGFPSCNDCDEDDATVFPGAIEVCDGVDHDCDGVVPRDGECDPFAEETLRVVGTCGATTVTPAGGAMGIGMLALLAFARRRE